MRILYYDCFAGLSGDMNLAALLDLGVAPEVLRAGLSKLGLDDEFCLKITRETRAGIRGTRVDVVLAGRDRPSLDHDHGHDHPHGHDHGHEHAHDHGHDGRPPRRGLADIEALIAASGLDATVIDTSLAIFRALATAEAKVHGLPVSEVHFHEVGATDAIVDIVGAAICLNQLGVDAVWASPVELGGGFVRCAHGLMPVPAPATAELLHGRPTTRGATPHEATTPTGAAILAGVATTFTDRPRLVTERTGYGIGHRDAGPLPNLLRVHLAQVADTPATVPGTVTAPARLLSCNIDDMTAELLAAALELFLEQGAMDAHATPIVMKKGRPATCLSLLCAPADEARFTELLFRHTTTLGVKSLALEKTVLATRLSRLDTPLGPVTLKQALLGDRVLRAKPEFEDCRALARLHGLPLAEVYDQIARARAVADDDHD